jgi:electron transport complex protein RnfA
MGGAVMFVMLVSSVCAYGIHIVLEWIGAPYLQLIAYIVVIASAVQLVEMIIKKFSPALFRALGIFLPLITTNCAILGVALFQTSREYDFVQSLAFALGAGVGFTIALVLMAGLRERLELSSVSSVVQGAAVTLILAGILSMAFMGFAGMGS